MEDSNKIVIKINYPGSDKPLKQDDDVGMVTEWHYKRILTAVVLLMVFIVAPFYFLNMPSSETPVKVDESDKALLAETKPKLKIKNIIEKSKAEPIITKKIEKIEKIEKIVEPTKPNITADVKTLIKVSNNKITRALLTTGLNNKEPINSINSTVITLIDKAAGIYYFTEIIDMKGQALYHHWFREDKLIYKRKINILGNRWRASTSKLIPYSKAGIWRVRLVNKQGVILNEIQFKVVQG